MTLFYIGALVCESGTKKHGGCSANKNAAIYTCTVPNVYSIVDVDVHNVVGGPQAANCTYHPGTIPSTWTEAMGGVFTFSGDTITVAGGCRAVFSVTFDACVNGYLVSIVFAIMWDHLFTYFLNYTTNLLIFITLLKNDDKYY